MIASAMLGALLGAQSTVPTSADDSLLAFRVMQSWAARTPIEQADASLDRSARLYPGEPEPVAVVALAPAASGVGPIHDILTS